MNHRLSTILISLSLAAAGCSSPSQHVLETHVDGGLRVKIEGIAWETRVELYAAVVELESEAEPGDIVAVACRLFEDRNGDRAFDPERDRSICEFNGSGDPHPIWHLGPLTGDLEGGTPCFETRVSTSEPAEFSQVFALEL